jgi:hypothetical protein
MRPGGTRKAEPAGFYDPDVLVHVPLLLGLHRKRQPAICPFTLSPEDLR